MVRLKKRLKNLIMNALYAVMKISYGLNALADFACQSRQKLFLFQRSNNFFKLLDTFFHFRKLTEKNIGAFVVAYIKSR